MNAPIRLGTMTDRISCKEPHISMVPRRAGKTPAQKAEARAAKAPLTHQGVRNLDSLAPRHLRNGNRFRPPKHYEVICGHPIESRDPQVKERTVEVAPPKGHEKTVQASTYTQEFEICLACGAEVNC